MLSLHRERKKDRRVQTDRRIMHREHKENNKPRTKKLCRTEKKPAEDYQLKRPNCKYAKKNETKARGELEDGEVSGNDSNGSAENSLPVCRFFLRNKCKWGQNCRFRHPINIGMGNYFMFERLQLPQAATPMPGACYKAASQPWLGPAEQEGSFNNNLHDHKDLMHNAGYELTKSAVRKVQHKPWIEFNDLDNDPYYTQQSPSISAAQPCSLEPEQHDSLHLNNFFDSDISSSDYSSTTNSTSSTSASSVARARTRKPARGPCTPSLSPMGILTNPLSQRKHHLLSSSSSSLSESSSTHSSEQSSSTADNQRFNRETTYSSRRAYISCASNRNRNSSYKYLESKLKVSEAKIHRKMARRKWWGKAIQYSKLVFLANQI